MKYILASLTALSTHAVMAHPGHDHSSWSAPFLHALWIMPAAIALGAAIYIIRKKTNK